MSKVIRGSAGSIVTPPSEKAPVGLIAGTGDFKHLPGDKDLAHGHFIFGQSAGLIRADDRHAAQSLDRGQPADQGVAFDHPLHAEGERDSDNGGEGLGDDGNRQRDTEDEHVDQRLAAQ